LDVETSLLNDYRSVVTVLEVIQRSSEFLTGKGVDSPRLQIELILGHVLRLPRLQLYLQFERSLSEDELQRVREMVKRRGKREPLQHILGSTSFCGLEIAVTRDVLVPRPETESLVEFAWKFLNETEQQSKKPGFALDFGTGSGCLAIAICVRVPSVRFCAIDNSLKALTIARVNAVQHHVESRIDFIHANDLDVLPRGTQFDLIVSNPPYIPTKEIEHLSAEVRDHDPRAALDGGAAGLDFFRLLADHARGRLHPHGRLMAEFGDGQAEAVSEIFARSGWRIRSVENDLSGRQRIVIACLPES
jgi:release factor glutamine methyltransferase